MNTIFGRTLYPEVYTFVMRRSRELGVDMTPDLLDELIKEYKSQDLII